MKDRIHKDLERAKVLCHAGDLLETYTLLKRYFDRLPFHAEQEHSQLISMFVWCLGELGRENDLKFYVGQLEKSLAAGAIYIQDVTDTNMSPNAVGPDGGSQPHDNFQPYLCVDFVISLFGIFPSQ